jgi:predicted GNAT family acetyltransferase
LGTADGARLSYTPVDGAFDFDHTEVPPQLRGSGVAAKLAQHALQHAAAQGWKVIPSCSYIALYIKRHPEFAPLIENPGQ